MLRAPHSASQGLPNPVAIDIGTRALGLHAFWQTTGVVLSAIAEHEGARIERTSIRWPVALRRHFLSGLYYSRRKCWPYTPYREAAYSGRRLERAQVDAAFGLASRSV